MKFPPISRKFVKNDSFAEARKFYQLLTCPSFQRIGRGCNIVFEVKNPKWETSYAQIFQDLFVSYLEDEGDKREYRLQLQEAREYLQKFSREDLEKLIRSVVSSGTWEKGLDIWRKEVLGEVIIGGPKKNGRIASRGVPKPRFKYLFPDGSIRELAACTAVRNFIKKGVNIIRLEE